MKVVKLRPFVKHHAIGYAFQVNVDDCGIELNDATPVVAWLGYKAHESDPSFTASPDLPGPGLSITGPWLAVARQIREITPTSPGLYVVFVEAWVNIVEAYPVPPVFKRTIYAGVPVTVV